MLAHLDHVAIAVADLRAAVVLFHDVLGLGFVGGGDNDELGIRVVQLRDAGGRKLELLAPTRPDSFLAAALARRGEGFHHVTGYVADVPEAVERLDAAGYATTGTAVDAATWQETFVRPSSAFGALIQLAHPDVPWSQPLVGVDVDDVLQGRVGIRVNTAWWKSTGEPIAPGSPSAAAQDRSPT